MGQFKPMVKMETTEPSVELKLKSGGHVKKMQMGGAPAAAPSMPARKGSMPARGGAMPAMAPKKPSMAARRRAMMARPSGAAPAGPVGMAGRMMKEGGEADLKKHAAMPASKAHAGLKTGGVVMGQGGFKKGGSVHTTKVDTAKPDHSPAKTGDVKMGNAGGYKKGGAAKYASGGRMSRLPSSLPPPSGTTAPDRPVPYNPEPERPVPPAPPPIPRTPEPPFYDPRRRPPSGSGRIQQMYAKGGKAYAKGGGVTGNVSTSHAGVTGTTTGEVKKANAGGYKEGGSAKKAFATGGLVNTGRPVAMPQGQKRPPSPVSINRLSGTYKKGGEVKMNGGGSASKGKIPSEAELELQVQRNQKAFEDYEKSRAEEAKADRDMIPNLAKRAISSMKRVFSASPAASAPGSVTKTEKSVTVAPGKKSGGRC